MRIALFHGYELSGSGSNEYTRYLARALALAGHEIHVLCREPNPAAVRGVAAARRWSADGSVELVFRAEARALGDYEVHMLPESDVRPVYVTDKQRTGNVKAFVDLNDGELERYRRTTASAVRAVLTAHPVDVLHANHVVLQPTIAADACAELGIPFVIYPHGSAIEYAVRRDIRYRELAGDAIAAAAGLIIGSREVQGRLLELYPDMQSRIRERTEIVGVGVDTALFSPVPRAERASSIQRLIEARPGGGKPPELRADLARRVRAEGLGAIRSHREAYAREQPDSDVAEHVDQIPWQSARTLLFVGALTVGKGLQSVIAAVPEILNRVPNAHLVIVGSGAYREVLETLVDAIAVGDERLLDELISRGYDLEDTHLRGPWLDVQSYLADPTARAAVLRAGPTLAARVHFLGRLGHELLSRLFPCADVAVFPSVVPEAYPLVLMESLSNGVMPAASNFSGFAEGLDHLVPHLGERLVASMRLPIAPEGRVAGIAERLSALLHDTAGVDHGPRLRAIAVEQYDWSVRADAMVVAYKRLVADNSR